MRSGSAEFDKVFAELRSILLPYQEQMVLVEDSACRYYLNTGHIMKNKKPLFFAAVQMGKRYVSFHLMPVYVEPGLLKGMSEGLRKRMQGKSCFNFTRTEGLPFKEIRQLTSAGARFYLCQGYIT